MQPEAVAAQTGAVLERAWRSLTVPRANGACGRSSSRIRLGHLQLEVGLSKGTEKVRSKKAQAPETPGSSGVSSKVASRQRGGRELI